MKKQDKEDFRKLSNEQLLKKKKEFEFLIAGSNIKFVNPIEKPSNRKRLKRMIAFINTIINERR